jgi:hypothetical protein
MAGESWESAFPQEACNRVSTRACQCRLLLHMRQRRVCLVPKGVLISVRPRGRSLQSRGEIRGNESPSTPRSCGVG